MAGVRARKVDQATLRPTPRRPGPASSIRLLGGFAVTHDVRDLRLPAASRRLLALIAVSHGPVPRAVAAERLWPHLSARSARGSLRTADYQLRSTHPALLKARRNPLELASNVQVDVHEIEAFARGLVTGHLPVDSDLSLDRLTLPLLPDWDDDWVARQRGRLEDLFAHALEACANRLAADGRFFFALSAIHAALDIDPLRESAVCTLIEIHLAEGNRALAVRCYLEFEQRLRTQLGMAPSDEMRALVAPLLARTRVGTTDLR